MRANFPWIFAYNFWRLSNIPLHMIFKNCGAKASHRNICLYFTDILITCEGFPKHFQNVFFENNKEKANVALKISKENCSQTFQSFYWRHFEGLLQRNSFAIALQLMTFCENGEIEVLILQSFTKTLVKFFANYMLGKLFGLRNSGGKRGRHPCAKIYAGQQSMSIIGILPHKMCTTMYTWDDWEEPYTN